MKAASPSSERGIIAYGFQRCPVHSVENKTTWFEEIFSGEIGQIGTQFDGLGHIGIGDLYYNGLDQHDFAQSRGTHRTRC